MTPATADWLPRLHIQATAPKTVFDAVTNADQAKVVEKYVMVRLDDLRLAMATLQTHQLSHGPPNGK